MSGIGGNLLGSSSGKTSLNSSITGVTSEGIVLSGILTTSLAVRIMNGASFLSLNQVLLH